MSMIHDLDHVLAAHRTAMTSEEFMAILTDATSSTDTLTAAERDFLTEHGGASIDAVDPARQSEAHQQIVLASVAGDAEAARDGYTTGEVAAKFGIKPANVRREVVGGGLYVAGRTRRREHVFPRWQFDENGPLPGLREVLAELPVDYHPLDVASFMTTPDETLGGRTPAAWLAGGGAVETVADLAGQLGYQ